MTFTHDMARLILVEQIYRSLTIIKNIPIITDEKLILLLNENNY